MFEFLPDWIKALIGTGFMVFIGVAGFRLTSKDSNKNSNSNEKKGS